MIVLYIVYVDDALSTIYFLPPRLVLSIHSNHWSLCFAACSKSHGIGNDAIPVSFSSASSSRPGHEPEKAQLLNDTGSWCAGQAKENEALQLDFGKTVVLTGIATQGHHSNNEYVSKYTFEYGVEGATWFTYTHAFNVNSRKNQLDANTDNASIRKIKFLYEVKARYLRIVAKLWHGGICLRVQLFGYNGKNSLSFFNIQSQHTSAFRFYGIYQFHGAS